MDSENRKQEEDFQELEQNLEYNAFQTRLRQRAEKAREKEDLEVALLAGFLSDRFLLEQIISKGFELALLKNKQARILCELLIELYEKKDQLVDAISLKDELVERELFNSEMEQFYEKVVECEPPSLSESMAYVDILKTRFGRENLIQINVLIEDYLNHEGPHKDKDTVEFIGEISRHLMSIQKIQMKEVILPMKYPLHEIEKEVRKRESTTTPEIMGFSLTPFSILNNALSGLRKGFYYGLAGAPRRGKTNFSLTLASHIARHQIPVLYYSWEQTQRILIYRILGRECMLNPSILQTKDIYQLPQGMEKVEKAWEECKSFIDYLFLIEGSQEESFEKIEAHVYNVMQEFNTQDVAIFIDYLQKIPIEGDYHNQQMRINAISSKLAELSLKLNNPVFAISSLDKEGCKLDERDSESAPTMHHCAGSGDIEYDLDVALILSKDWYDTAELHNQLKDLARAKKIPEKKIPKLDIVNLTIDKNRDAPPGISPIIQYLFFIEENKFLELGYKDIEEKHTYNKIAQLIQKLLSEKLIFADEEIDLSVKVDESKIEDEIIHNL